MTQHSLEGGEPQDIHITGPWSTYDLGIIHEPSHDPTDGYILEYDDYNRPYLVFEALGSTAIQLALNLQWGDVEPPDFNETRLSLEEFAVTRRLLTIAVEILDGHRPLFDLYGQLSDRLYASMTTKLQQLRRPQSPARLCSVHAQHPARNVIEACGVLERSGRVKALVARLERQRRRWIGTTLRVL